MRKLFSLFVALLAITSLWAYDFQSGDLYYKITSSSEPYTVEVVYQEYSSSENYHGLTTVVIPETITYDGNTYSITSIGQSAFADCSSLTSVIIGDSVKSIDLGAFSSCQNLTSLVIGNSVTSIIQCAFVSCTSLTNVIIPNSVTEIDWGAFWKCSGLTHLTIGKNVTFINQNAFADCCNLTSITLLPEAPPTCSNDAWAFVSSSTPIYVPCGCVDAYKNADGWSSFYNIQELLSGYNLEVYTKFSDMGIVQVDKNSTCGAQVSAVANYGYHFTQWNDGVTDNPRTFVITQDTTFTAEFAPNQYTITTVSADEEMGYTEGDTVANYLEYITLSAIANYGYHFVGWSDYTYENPRVVQVTEDMTYTAYFDKNTYYITKNYDSNQGYVDGYSSGEYLDNITLIAEPNYGYHFVRWSDGNTDNPRHFILTQDTTFSAEFAQTFSGQCGDNLYWSYQNNTLTILGFGEMYDNRPWGLFRNEIQTVVLPNGITHIGNDAFSDCTGLSEITIPYTVTSIGDYAFAGCRKLVQVNCYAINPPMAESTSFANYNVYLNVPCDNLQDYQLDMVFGSFKYIQCMEADSENVPTDDVVVTPGTNDVTITWPTAENADTYTIVIQKGSEVFCTLTFNADGQLLNIAFAPGRNGNHPAQYAEQTTNGYRFTVTGLEEGTHYIYNIDVRDTANKTIKSHTGEFTTESMTAVENTHSQSSMTNAQKILRNGQLLIIRDGKTYNAMGKEM